MKLRNWLAASAVAYPERAALSSEGRSFTYAELERHAASAARRLARLGARRQVPVALVLEASAQHVVLLHALAKLGAVAVPLDARLPARELDARIDRAAAGLVIHDWREVEEAGEEDVALDQEVESDAVHGVIFTSGTAGGAKPVELTYGNHLWSAVGSALRIGVQPEDRWLCCLPLHHVGGLAIVLRSAIYGTAAVVEQFEPKTLAQLVGSGQVTLASLVGTTLGHLLDAGAELERLRCALVGGGPVSEDLIERALAARAPIAPTYGLTEAASQVATLPPGQASRRPGSAGPPLLPTSVRIDDDGAILVSGPTVAPGSADADGWLRTGDRGRLEGGHLYVLGRADELIVTGGEKVVPEEVERTLLSHPAVVDAAVAGRDDPQWGRAVVATVVLRNSASAEEQELREFCRERLSGYQVPKRIEFASSLPRDAQGKLRRRELR